MMNDAFESTIVRRIQATADNIDQWMQSPMMIDPIEVETGANELIDTWAIRLSLQQHAPEVQAGARALPDVKKILEVPGNFGKAKKRVEEFLAAEAKGITIWVEILRELMRGQ